MAATVIVPNAAQWQVLTDLGLVGSQPDLGVVLMSPAMAEQLGGAYALNGMQLEAYDFGGEPELTIDTVVAPASYAVPAIRAALQPRVVVVTDDSYDATIERIEQVIGAAGSRPAAETEELRQLADAVHPYEAVAYPLDEGLVPADGDTTAAIEARHDADTTPDQSAAEAYDWDVLECRTCDGEPL